MSADKVKAQKNFCVKQNFPFSLLSDPEKTTIRAYEAIGMKKMYGREYEGIYRMTFIFDSDGILERVIDKVNTKDHTNQILNG